AGCRGDTPIGRRTESEVETVLHHDDTRVAGPQRIERAVGRSVVAHDDLVHAIGAKTLHARDEMRTRVVVDDNRAHAIKAGVGCFSGQGQTGTSPAWQARRSRPST